MSLRAAAYTLRQVLTSRMSLAASLADLRPRPDRLPDARHLREAVSWLCGAQDAVAGGGVSYGYDLRRGWLPAYPETTGYIITTFLRCARDRRSVTAGVNPSDLRQRAERMAYWLTTVQLESGAIPGGTVGYEPAPTVFNTGQVLEGWSEMVRERPDPGLAQCLHRAARWLVEVQDRDGCWRTHLSPLTVQTPAAYNTRTAAALLKAGRQFHEPTWSRMALRNFDWALTQQNDRGWFDHNCLTDRSRPLTHTIGYTLEALLDAADCSGDERYLDAVGRASELLRTAVRPSGFLSGRLDAHWRPLVSWCCLTGSCQLAMVWFRLAKVLDDPSYSEVARRLLSFVKSTQKLSSTEQAPTLGSRKDGTWGGIKGSHPIWGEYDAFRYPNWAAKFFVDALLVAPDEVEDKSAIAPSDRGTNVPIHANGSGVPPRSKTANSAPLTAASKLGPAKKPVIFTYTAILSSTGGGQHAMTLLARELNARGYESLFFTRPPLRREHRYAQWLTDLGIRIEVLSRFDTSWWALVILALGSPLLILPYALRRRCRLSIARQAARSIVQTKIARFEHQYVLRRLTRRLREKTADGTPVILHVWGPAALTPLLLEWADHQGVPAIYHEMGEADDKYIETWDLAATVAAIRRAATVICCSGSVEANIRRSYGYGGRIETIPFIIADPGSSLALGRKSGGRLTFGAIGRLVPHKRHADLLAAIKSLTEAGYDLALLIAGGGPLLPTLQKEAERLGIVDRVTFTGEFERLEDVMPLFDVFVLASSSESQCMPITESMAYGKPVVATAFGGMPDFVAEGVTGFLVPVGNVPALVTALKALAVDPSLRKSMGEEGRRRYLERYTPQRITSAVEGVYGKLLAQRPAAGLNLGYMVECYPTFIVDEIRWLRQLGARVTLLSAFRPTAERDPLKDDYRRESLYFPNWYRGVLTANVLSFLTRPLIYVRLLRLVWREGESLRMFTLASYFAKKIRQLGIQHLHGTFGTRTTTLAYLVSRLSGRDFSFTTHAYDIYRPNPSVVWKTNQSRFMRTISRFNKKQIGQVYKGTNLSKIHVVYLGVDTKVFTPRQSPNAPTVPFRLIAVGDLIEQKGHVVLIRACKLLVDQGYNVLCEIIGDGEKRGVVEKELNRLAMADHVHLIGRIRFAEVQQRLREAQIFVLPCIDLRGQGEHIDGIPVALMEAMAKGMPVVSTNISGIPELIEDGVSGLLVPEKDHVLLAEALRRLIVDADLRTTLGNAARKTIETRFDLETNVKTLAECFRNRP